MKLNEKKGRLRLISHQSDDLRGHYWNTYTESSNGNVSSNLGKSWPFIFLSMSTVARDHDRQSESLLESDRPACFASFIVWGLHKGYRPHIEKKNGSPTFSNPGDIITPFNSSCDQTQLFNDNQIFEISEFLCAEHSVLLKRVSYFAKKKCLYICEEA